MRQWQCAVLLTSGVQAELTGGVQAELTGGVQAELTGGVQVELTSGNTGTGLAIVCGISGKSHIAEQTTSEQRAEEGPRERNGPRE